GVVHEKPALACVAPAHVALALLDGGAFPAGAEVLVRYVDGVHQGAVGMSLANPFSLYAAYQVLTGRLLRRDWNSNQEQWQERVRLGLRLVAYTLSEAARRTASVADVDAFACPDVLGEADRDEVRGDLEGYRRKLADPRCGARRVRLRLPGQLGGQVEAETLLVRDVQNVGDPDRCLFFKDWARTDAALCPGGVGFVGLSVFSSEGP